MEYKLDKPGGMLWWSTMLCWLCHRCAAASSLEPFVACRYHSCETQSAGHRSVVTKKSNTWYVSVHFPVEQKTGHSLRPEAKQFAAGKMAGGVEISAGTLNPATPKRVIRPSEIDKWLSEKSKPLAS